VNKTRSAIDEIGWAFTSEGRWRGSATGNEAYAAGEHGTPTRYVVPRPSNREVDVVLAQAWFPARLSVQTCPQKVSPFRWS